MKKFRRIETFIFFLFLLILLAFWFYPKISVKQGMESSVNVNKENVNKVLIKIFPTYYLPNETQIRVGDVVAWKNMDTKPHILVITQVPLQKRIMPGDTFEFKFVRNGTFDFWDYDVVGMMGIIRVVE